MGYRKKYDCRDAARRLNFDNMSADEEEQPLAENAEAAALLDDTPLLDELTSEPLEGVTLTLPTPAPHPSPASSVDEPTILFGEGFLQ